jgi:ribokinase
MKKSEVKLVLVGDIALNQDITPHGEKISPGGAAYYSMVGAARFSDEVGVVGKIGSDFNPQLLNRRNIDLNGIQIESGDTCRFILTQYPDNTRNFEAKRGVAEDVDTTIFPEAYLDAQFIHLPTQLPEHALIWQEYFQGHRGISVDSFEAFIKSYPELTLRMFEQADMIFINHEEYQALGLNSDAYKDKPLVHKLGPGGVIYRSPNETLSIPAPKVYPLETTGAGDVLAGAFLALLSVGWNTSDALERAVMLASTSVIDFGVEHLPTKESMERKPEIVTAALLVNEQGEIFLGRSKKFQNAWIAPGGHLHDGEPPEIGVVREISEELGIQVSAPIFLETHEWFAPEYKDQGAVFLCHNYVINIQSDQKIQLNDEYDQYVFLSPREALDLEGLHPTARMIIGYYLTQ